MTDMTCFQIPKRGEEPSEDMVEWLAECEQDWDGDDEGVNIHPVGGGEPVLGNPGDWIYRIDGVYHIVTAKQLSEDADLLKSLGVE